MEVRPGYKMTEVGVIPEEWEVVSLGAEVAQLEAGVSVNSVDGEIGSYTQDPAVLKTSAISEGIFLPHESKKIAPHDIQRAKLTPRCDTIIISRMNTPDLVGECGYVFADFPNLFLPDRLWMTRNRPGSKACVRWLNYLLSSKHYKNRIKELATGTSGSMKNIAKDSFLAISIPYPTPTEQRAIADALSDVDGLLSGLDRLIAKKRDLKQAAMQQLLTGETRLPGFSGEWAETTLGEVSAFLKGKGLPKSAISQHGAEPCIHYGELFTQYSEAIRNTLSRTNETRNCVRSVKNDVLMPTSDVTPRGLAKASCVLMDGFILGGDILIIRSDRSHIVGTFLSYVIRREENQVLQLVTGTTVYHLYGSNMQKFKLRLPSISEQTAIVEVLSDMDAELAALEQRLEKTRALKQAMMQELLTGNTRLV